MTTCNLDDSSIVKELCWKCKGHGYKYNKATKKFDGKLCGCCNGTGKRKASTRAQTLANQSGKIVKLRGNPVDGTFAGPPAYGSVKYDEPSPSLVKTGEILGALCCGNWRIFQLAAGHKLTVDDFICAWVASEEMRKRGYGPETGTFGTVASSDRKTFTHADIGCGCGSVLMTIAWAFPGSVISSGVEAQSRSFDLLKRGILWNLGPECNTMHVENQDLRQWNANGQKFDLITGTPPYFPLDKFVPSQNHSQKVRCRVPTRGAASDYMAAASKLLSSTGLFVMVESSHSAAEKAVIEAAKLYQLRILKRVDIIPRHGLPSRFSCWVMEKKILVGNTNDLNANRSFPISDFRIRLGQEDNYRRSNEYLVAMKHMGWINYEACKKKKTNKKTVNSKSCIPSSVLDCMTTISSTLSRTHSNINSKTMCIGIIIIALGVLSWRSK